MLSASFASTLLVLLILLCIPWTESASKIGKSQRQLADTLTASWYGGGTKNQCSSSLGIAMAFSLVLDVKAFGNNNNTNASVASDLESIGLSVNYSVWKQTSDELEDIYNGTCVMEESSCGESSREPILTFANSVWTQANRNLSAEYLAYILGNNETDATNDVLRAIDFQDNSAGSIVNDWVNVSTNGLIDSIVQDGSLGNIQFIAINALYFKAVWVKAFDMQMSTMDPFYAASTNSNTTNSSLAVFMHRVEELPYAQVTISSTTTNSSYQVVKLPFLAREDISLLIVMGTSSTTKLIRQDELVQIILPQLQTTAVALALPKFTVQSQYNTNQFRKALSDSGVFDVPICIYDEKSNVTDACLTIDEIIHEAVIEVNEEGVTAAAVTAVIGRSFPLYPENPILMLVDRPFQFFLYEATNDLILMEGYVAEAITNDDLPQMNVTKSHNDADFWEFMFGVTLRDNVSSPMGLSSAPFMPTAFTPTEAPSNRPANATTTKAPTTKAPTTKAPTTKAPTKDSPVESTSGQTMTQPQSSALYTMPPSGFPCYYAVPLLLLLVSFW